MKLYGLLREYRPTGKIGHQPFVVNVTPLATVAEVMTQLGVPDGLVTAVARNGLITALDARLQPHDRVELFPPTAGG